MVAGTGFALLLVVVALAVLGALTLTAFGAGRRAWRNAADVGAAAEAFEAAEAGLAMGRAAADGLGGAPIARAAGRTVGIGSPDTVHDDHLATQCIPDAGHGHW